MNYQKPHLSFDDQIDLLESRGLSIYNKAYAKSRLNHINYYRLSAYFIPFQDQKDTFISGTTFEAIIRLYTFDQEVRILIFNTIEKREIFLRTQIAYHFSKNYGAFGYLDKTNFNTDDKDFDWLQGEIQKELARSKETFVNHYRTKYGSSDLPIWMVVEIISFGTLSKFYSCLKKEDAQAVCDGIALKPFIFKNWLHVLSYVRNICAHHARV